MVGCVVVHHFPCAHCTIIHMDRPHQTTPPAPMLLSIGGRPFQSPPPPSPALIDMSPEPPTCTPTRTHRHESSTTHPCPYSFIFSTTSPTSQSSTAHARPWLRRAAAAPPPCFPLSPAFFNSPLPLPNPAPKSDASTHQSHHPSPNNNTQDPRLPRHDFDLCCCCCSFYVLHGFDVGPPSQRSHRHEGTTRHGEVRPLIHMSTHDKQNSQGSANAQHTLDLITYTSDQEAN